MGQVVYMAMGTRRVVVDYEPTPKQRMFHASTANELLFGGAAGGGKSKAIVMDAFFRCLQFPGTVAYIFRRTYAELEDTIIREMRRSYPKGIGVYNVSRHEWSFPNGSKILCRHCADVQSMYDYKGAEIQWLYFDELTSFPYQIYEFIRTRLRAPKILGVTPITRSASNPGDIGHGWVKERFVDAGEYGAMIPVETYSEVLKRKEISYVQYIPSLATENPHITQQYIMELERKAPALRDAYLFGNWNAFEGQVFTEWRDAQDHYKDRLYTHVIDPFEIPPSWPRYMSYDHGFAKPFSCGWWAIGPDGTAYRYREWYGWNGTPDTGCEMPVGLIAQGIKDRERREALEGIEIDRICDPALFHRTTGDSVKQQFDQHGIYFRRGEHDRMAGKSEFHERLRFRDHRALDRQTGETAAYEKAKPMLYVFSTCKHFRRTIPTLPYSLTKAEDVNTDAEDHVYDEARYFLMSRPMLPENQKIIRPREFSPYDDEGDSVYARY